MPNEPLKTPEEILDQCTTGVLHDNMEFVSTAEALAAIEAYHAQFVSQPSGEAWRSLPFHVKHLYNDNWYPGETEKGYMNEDSYKAAMDAYDKTEKDVVFEDVYVSFDSCDCGGEYGCSHGSWPFEISTKDKSEKLDFEDDGLHFEKGDKSVFIPDHTKITLGDFYDLCSIVGIKLTVRPSFAGAQSTQAEVKELKANQDEPDIYDAVASYPKDHSNDTEGSQGGGC